MGKGKVRVQSLNPESKYYVKIAPSLFVEPNMYGILLKTEAVLVSAELATSLYNQLKSHGLNCEIIEVYNSVRKVILA